ncbi:M24 family metallopeptidase [Phreatobacter stygius]|uniref:Aminopeptidase P family protein n=1 Tax=Phreatobacter stygius TaxID=1940610 RepID=A0A4D7BGH0_9HYPH|nr:Xaa-Pro peptidase family protein [Phreatobacter stygius]QCI66877.1 aminopeptidase P family protein [Phreatobacter stygius]
MSKADFSSAEFAARLQRVRQAIAAAELDWMVLFHPVSIHWLTGSDAKSYQAFQCLIVSAEDRPGVMLTRESERYEFEQDALIDQLETWGGAEPEDPIDVFERIAGRLGLKRGRVGMEVPAYYLHPHHYMRVKTFLGAALKAEPSNLVHDLKMVKSPAELAYVRQSARIADEALEVFVAHLNEGTAELAIAGEVYAALLKRGSGLPASTLNLVSGERSCFSHGAPTERRLRQGDFGNVEYGAAFKRYTATIGRQFCMGMPTPRMNELHAIALEAADAMIGEIRDGVPALAPHEAAKRVIGREGLDRYRIHTSGYGLAPGFPPSWGEPVNMFGGATYTLRAGMVVSVEPPIFIGEEGLGVRLIDNVLVTATGAELLSRQPRGLIMAG